MRSMPFQKLFTTGGFLVHVRQHVRASWRGRDMAPGNLRVCLAFAAIVTCMSRKFGSKAPVAGPTVLATEKTDDSLPFLLLGTCGVLVVLSTVFMIITRRRRQPLAADNVMAISSTVENSNAPASSVEAPSSAEATSSEDSGVTTYAHDMRFGIPPDAAELMSGDDVAPNAWVWVQGRRVGDTSLELPDKLMLCLRLPATLWVGGQTDEPVR